MPDEAQAEWISLVVVTLRAARGCPDKAALFDTALRRLRAEATLAEELCLVAALEMRRMKYSYSYHLCTRSFDPLRRFEHWGFISGVRGWGHSPA